MHNKKLKLQWLGKKINKKFLFIYIKNHHFSFRANNARSKAHSAEIYAKQARMDSIEARGSAKAAAPDFRQPGEEKPQPFILLDIDRQMDGKLIISNHISVSPPNGRLPMPSNHVPNPSIPLPSHLSQRQPQAFMLDGGVYQGQPLITQSNEWNANIKVK